MRASNCLESVKVETVRQLVQMTEADLLKIRSFGKTSLREIKRKLADIGLSLGMKDVGSRPEAVIRELSSENLDLEEVFGICVIELQDAS